MWIHNIAARHLTESIIILLLVLICLCYTVCCYPSCLALMDWASPDLDPTAQLLVVPTLNITPPPPSAQETLEILTRTEIPPRDRAELAERFLGMTAVPTALPEPTSYELGDVELFWAENSETDEVFRVTARLEYVTPHVYMWVEEGIPFNEEALAESAERFENHTYPTTRLYFGSEWTPGIDGDPHLHILHTTGLAPSVAGYFYSPSEYPAAIVPYSNEKEMFYIHITNTYPGDPFYDGVLAHEFQHMIHWNVDSNEDSWLNEGLSELAVLLSDFGGSGGVYAFLSNPDLQLTHWPEGPTGRSANYGAAFLFATYFLERCDAEGVTRLASNPLNGMAGVDDTLSQLYADGYLDEPLSADQLFGDWAVANLLNDSSIADGSYAYTRFPHMPDVIITSEHSDYPADGLEQVSQHGTDYIALHGPGTFRVSFEGSQQVRVIPTDTQGGIWWSNRGDDSDMTLTGNFDLSGVAQATLEYDVWYWIEEAWDYGYVEISLDGGQSWAILQTPHTTNEDPHGNAYGSGYTGISSDSEDATPAGWIRESIDLTPFTGSVVTLRFEMITDDSVNQAGMALDNICIPAIDFCDEAEEVLPVWDARGFVRHNNTLPQRLLVQVILPHSDGTIEVWPLPLDEANQGETMLTIGPQPAFLVISGLTPFTTEVATYSYRVERIEE